jgi:pimeloyl-ACP methyl ester carboxylesterase
VIANYRDHYLPFKPSLLGRLDELRGKALGCGVRRCRATRTFSPRRWSDGAGSYHGLRWWRRRGGRLMENRASEPGTQTSRPGAAADHGPAIEEVPALSSPTSHSLNVPGARLYYEVQGSGPVLMLIGHPMDSSGFAGMAPLLAEDHTVVTYDPRGFGRSTIDDHDQDAEPDLLADDVRRVLEAVGGGPAQVFGSSGGAVTGLALVARHPDHVQTLVAHEPPVALVLPDAEEARAAVHDIYDTYRNSDTGAAWQKFFVFAGLEMPPQGQAASSPPSEEMVATSERFFGHGLLPITLYEPDIAALRIAPTRVVVAGGTTSRGDFAQRAAAALAERLGTPLVDFPGDHGGFATEAEDFVAVLRRTLA